MGLGGLLGPWQAAKGQFKAGTMQVQTVPYHLRPSQKPTKAYKDLSGFFLGLKRGPNGQLYASPVLVHMGLSVF